MAGSGRDVGRGRDDFAAEEMGWRWEREGALSEPVMEMAEEDGRGWDLAGRSVS